MDTGRVAPVRPRARPLQVPAGSNETYVHHIYSPPFCYTLRSMNLFGLLAVGLVAGVCAGMFGIGGGLIIVPALLYFFKMTELQSIGTSLAALILPVGLLGAAEYYRNGYINIRYAAL